MVPMAVSIVGGVSVSTLLTLFVVPCAYEVFSRFEKQGYRQFKDEDLGSYLPPEPESTKMPR
jgi:hypothetical protein